MIAFLELILFLFLLPYLLFGLVLGYLFDGIVTIFHPPTLLAGIWVLIGGLLLIPHAKPDDLPFESIAQILARSHIFGVDTPFSLILAGGALVVLAAVIRLVQPRLR